MQQGTSQQQAQAQQQQQLQGNGSGAPNGGSFARGFSSGSGGGSGGSGNPQLLVGGGAAGHMARPASSSLLTGLQGMPGVEQLLPTGAGPGGANLPHELAAALTSSLTQQAGGLQLPQPLMGQVMQLLHSQQAAMQQQQQPGGPPQPPLAWQAPAPQAEQQRQAAAALAGHGGLPPLMPMAHDGGEQHPSRGPPPAPLLSNLGLPVRADSKLQSVGPGMGSLDILAAADFEMSGAWVGRCAGAAGRGARAACSAAGPSSPAPALCAPLPTPPAQLAT